MTLRSYSPCKVPPISSSVVVAAKNIKLLINKEIFGYEQFPKSPLPNSLQNCNTNIYLKKTFMCMDAPHNFFYLKNNLCTKRFGVATSIKFNLPLKVQEAKFRAHMS